MITIKGIYGREMFETWYAMSVLLEGGLDLVPVITGRFAYRDFDAAFDDAGERPRRQGHPRLDRLTVRPSRSSFGRCSTPCATTCAPPSTRSARPGCTSPSA